ncbi:MAG: RluA family pseudouridine synthase [Verrucomicrobiaceae bacterium]|nr:MAG: RluA family pseudouridine synthase [Verrucomicrobiaceae bacterium]
MQKPRESRILSSGEAGVRLDHFLGTWITGFSRVRLQGFVKDGHVLLNGAPSRPSQLLRAGDCVEIGIPEESTPAPAPAQDIPLDILHESAEFLVLNKPAGLVVHPGAGNADGTVVNAILHHCSGIRIVGGEDRPGIVHRLDKETSGCLLIAKTESAHRHLSAEFAERHVEKTYLALVEGILRMPHGTIEAPIGRHAVHRQKMAVVDRGRHSITKYRLLASSEGKSLVECRPHTGRTHQIRVHLKHLGHPVVGDPLYGRRGSHSRHFLHAWKIAFADPSTGKPVSFTAPVPADFPAWAIEAAGKQKR